MAIIFLPNDIIEKLLNEEITFKQACNYLIQPNNVNLKKEASVLEYVYIIRSGPWHKIGRTTNIKTRLKSYLTTDPLAKVIFQKKCKNSSKLEKIMLDIFPEKRVGNSEWYKLEKGDIKKIKDIAKINI